MATLLAAIDARKSKSGAAVHNKAVDSMGKAARDAQGRFVGMDKALGKVGKTAKANENLLGRVLAIGTAIAAGKKALGVLTGFETGLVGVGKTSDIQGAALASLGSDFIGLSQDIPVATAELLAIGQAAGQLGVKGSENILTFTETVAALGVASDLAGDEAATVLARLLNVTGESVSEVGTLASVIVALGNNFAATESEIARTTTQIAQATTVFDIGSTNAAGFGTALAALGARAELSGSAIGRTFRAIDSAVRERGDELARLATLTGKTGDEFAAIFGRDATEGVVLFLEGLGGVIEDGGDAAATLAEFGLSGEEVLKILPTLASRVDILTDALGVANAEQEEATALAEESERAYSTLDASFTRFGNTVGAAVLQLRASTGPLSDIVDFGGDVVRVFAGIDSSARPAGTAARVLGVSLQVAAVAGLALVAVPIEAALLKAGAGFAKLGAFLATNPIGAAAIAIGALAVAFTAFIPTVESAASATRRFRGEVTDLTDAAESLDRIRAQRGTLIAVGAGTDELEANARSQVRALEDAATSIAQQLENDPSAVIDFSDLLAITPDLPQDVVDELIAQGQAARDAALADLAANPADRSIVSDLLGISRSATSTDNAAAGQVAGNVELSRALELVQGAARSAREELGGYNDVAGEGVEVGAAAASATMANADAFKALAEAQAEARQGAADLVGGLQMELELLGLSEDARRRLIAQQELSALSSNIEAEEAAAFGRELNETLRQLEVVGEAERIAEGVADAFGGAFESVLFEGASFEDALNGLFLDISRSVVQESLIGPLKENITGFLTGAAGEGAAGGASGGLGAIFSGLFGAANGAVFSGGLPMDGFQFGGVPSAGQAFGVQSNGQPFTLNEAGPEAIMRLGRDSTGQLGVRAIGGDGGGVKRSGGGATTIVQNFPNADPGQFRQTAMQGVSDAKRAARV